MKGGLSGAAALLLDNFLCEGEVMAHPKRRHSVSRKKMRRAHDFLTSPILGQCPKCGSRTRSHQVCGYCGYYRGKDVVKMESEAEAGEKK